MKKKRQPVVITCRTNADVMRADQSVGPGERELRFEPAAIFPEKKNEMK